MGRVPEPRTNDERELLLGWLAFHRNALAAKCDGLSDDQLMAMSAEPSDLSLLGLVRHLTEMEYYYLAHAIARGDSTPIYCTDDDEDADIVGLTAGMARASLNRWQAECGTSDVGLVTVDALDARAPATVSPYAGT